MRRVRRRLARVYLGANRRIWFRVPPPVQRSGLGRAYGRHLHSLVCHYSERKQNHSTWFLRNRPELELLSRVAMRKAHGSRLDICVLACSKGAEVYSILWAIRSARPDLDVRLRAVDISEDVVEFARRGEYSLRMPAPADRDVDGAALTGAERLARDTYRDQGFKQDVSIFERMTDAEMHSMFTLDGDRATVRSWLREGVTWMTGDANDPELARQLGPQDIVVANRFLCHMDAAAAQACLSNIGRLVKPGGHLFVSGVDLDVRTRVADAFGWKPVPDLLREVHEGDASLIGGWPFGWYGIEPFSDDLPDWKIRYASAFQVGEAA